MNISKFDDKYSNKEFSTLSDINNLESLKKNILLDIKVASLGIVKQISQDLQILKVDLIPKTSHTTKLVECFNNLTNIKVGDCVVIIFLDYNFLQNIRQLKNKQELSYLNNTNEVHSERFGIAISKLNI